MTESPQVVAFYRTIYRRAAQNLLQMVQGYRWDFAALGDHYIRAIEAQKQCCDAGLWELVLQYMSAMETFLYWQGHWSEGADGATYAQQAAEHLGDRKALAYWIFYAGLMHDEMGRHDVAENKYRACLQLAQAERALTTQGKAWRRLGWVAQVNGNGKEAKNSYLQAIELHRQAQDALEEAQDWRQLGALQLIQGNYGEAEKSLRTGLGLIRAKDSPEAQRVQAGVELCLGQIALQHGQFDQAQQHLEQARLYSHKSQDARLQTDVYIQLARVAEERRDWQTADQWYQERLRLDKESHDWLGQATAWTGRGIVATRRYEQQLHSAGPLASNYYDLACHYYDLAAPFANRLGKAVIQAQRGNLERLRGDYAQARELLAAAAKSFEELGAKHEAVRSLYELGNLARQQGQVDAARQYYGLALEMGRTCNFPYLGQVKAALDSLVPRRPLTFRRNPPGGKR